MIIPEGFRITMNRIFLFAEGVERSGKIVRYWSKMKLMTINISGRTGGKNNMLESKKTKCGECFSIFGRRVAWND